MGGSLSSGIPNTCSALHRLAAEPVPVRSRHRGPVFRDFGRCRFLVEYGVQDGNCSCNCNLPAGRCGRPRSSDDRNREFCARKRRARFLYGYSAAAALRRAVVGCNEEKGAGILVAIYTSSNSSPRADVRAMVGNHGVPDDVLMIVALGEQQDGDTVDRFGVKRRSKPPPRFEAPLCLRGGSRAGSAGPCQVRPCS
jgi:hypothetical protein